MFGFKKKKIETIESKNEMEELEKWVALGRHRYAFSILFHEFASVVDHYDVFDDHIICYMKENLEISPLFFRYDGIDDWVLQPYIK